METLDNDADDLQIGTGDTDPRVCRSSVPVGYVEEVAKHLRYMMAVVSKESRRPT